MSSSPFATRPVRLAPDATDPSSSDDGGGRRELALVLGGGGSTGNAWLIGVLAGLLDAGVDVTDADLVVGTSAGATAAAQVTGGDLAELYAAVVDAAAPPARRPGGGGPARPVVNHLRRTAEIIEASDGPADLRRRLGTAALQLDGADDPAAHEQWRSMVAARLPRQDWPDRRVQLVAVDARTGEPVVFDRHSGVSLADAVAASCASGRPHGVGPERYLDGGYRRNENADLATGYARVLVLSPFGGRSRHPHQWGMALSTQVEELRAAGSRVETIVPGADAEHLFGTAAMDLSLRPAAARAGYDVGKASAAAVASSLLGGDGR